ncbi:response regulator [Occallatibacter savannae]|uniref:response regulator n=1 Tax=Occallatibacter savannae TaxID=1002691 RepID=UPI000D694930|nr:response regulator [Occallatibacter savannae]
MDGSRVSRLLVLDDERTIADTMCLIANQAGYEARPAYDHESAIAIAHEYRPDFFIFGFNNGWGKNGCETAIELEGFLPQCVLALFSGSSAAAPVLEEYRQRGREFQILPKPVHPQVFLDWLKSNGGRAGEKIMHNEFLVGSARVAPAWRGILARLFGW